MSGTTDIVRVKKVEKIDGTYYYPQKRVWKTRWFSESGYVWENFFLVSKTTEGFTENCFVSEDELRFNSSIISKYKNLGWAERDCKEYIRIYHSDEVVKIWSVRD